MLLVLSELIGYLSRHFMIQIRHNSISIWLIRQLLDPRQSASVTARRADGKLQEDPESESVGGIQRPEDVVRLVALHVSQSEIPTPAKVRQRLITLGRNVIAQ